MRRLYADEFHPKSELVVEQHLDVMPPVPVIDMHAHFGRLLLGEQYEDAFDTRELCSWFKERGLEKVFCLELEWDKEYDRLCRKLEASDGMILPVGSVDVFRAMEPGFDALVYKTLTDLKRKGCVALKLWKNMTLMGEKHFGKNIPLDSPYYEPIWHYCGELGLPIIIHVADPPCFFRETDENNEHYICLSQHPEWSFFRPGMFSFEEHMAMQEAVIRDHPGTQFIVAHVGSHAEDLGAVSRWMEKYPNMMVDIAARLDQLGRQPYTARAFFERFQDRILFGTDYEATFTRERTLDFYTTHYRFLQTYDEYMDHPFPDFLGQWKICGIGLGKDVLRKVYRDNAKRVFGI